MHHQVKIVNSSLPECYKKITHLFKKKFKKINSNQGQLPSSTN